MTRTEATMEPLDHGERIVSAWHVKGDVYAMTETGTLLRLHDTRWVRESTIPRKRSPLQDWMVDQDPGS